jgi:hypothetical protein
VSVASYKADSSEVRLGDRQTHRGSKDPVVMTTAADLPNPSYEFGHLLYSTGPNSQTNLHSCCQRLIAQEHVLGSLYNDPSSTAKVI